MIFQVSNGGGTKNSRPTVSLCSSRLRTAYSETSETEDDCSKNEAAEITELAQQLGRIGNPETLSTMSEHLQV